MMLLSLIGIAGLLTWLMQQNGLMGGIVGSGLIGLTSLAMLRWSHRHSQEKNETQAAPLPAPQVDFDYFKEFVDRLPVPAFIKDSESSTIYVNSCYATIFGSGWVGKSVWDFFPAAIAQQMVAADQKALYSGTKEIFESVPVPSGTGRMFQTIKFPLYHNDTPTLLAGFGIEITQRQWAEASLEQMNTQLNIINAELESRNRNTQLLLEFSNALQSCHALEQVTTAITQFIPQLLPQYTGLVALKLPDQTRLQVLSTWGFPPDTAVPSTLPCQMCWIWKQLKAPEIWQAHPDQICSQPAGSDPVYYTCIPIYDTVSPATLTAPSVTGVMHFYLPTGEPIPDLALQLAKSILAAINQTLLNVNLRQTLHEQSIRDPLTNLFNRRYLQETLTRELARSAREQNSVALIVMDIDRFKQINDTYGHANGDRVLQQLAQLLQHQTRQGDIVCRYGGEEFVIVLPTATLTTAYERAEAIRYAFATLAIVCNDTVIHATLSAGVAAYPLNGLTDDEIFCAADAALYLAKANGRNCTLMSQRSGRSPVAQQFRRDQPLREKDGADDDQQPEDDQPPISQELG